MRAGALLRAALAASSFLGVGVSAGASEEREAEDRERFCFQACMSGVKSVKFRDIDSTAPPGPGFCRSELAGWSLVLCMRVYCAGREEEEMRTLNGTCTGMGRALPSLEEVDVKWPEERWGQLRRIGVDDREKGEVLGEVGIPEERFLWLWVQTFSASEYVHYYHRTYGLAMIGYWVVIIAIGTLARASSRFSGPSARDSGFGRWYKANVSLPMAHGQTSWASTPTREQAIVAGLLVFVNTVVCCVGYRFFEGNMYYPSITNQVLRYVSDRTGIVSFANFPMIWLFGMRNNVVSWVTGWDFGGCTVFHRWVARVAAVQAVVHSIGYTILVIREGGWAGFIAWWSWMFWWAGELATIFMCGVVAFSFYWVRKKHYETFLVSHIWLSALTLITMLMHVSIFKGLYDPLANIPIAIWLVDRVARVGKILLFNPRFWTTRAETTYDVDANVVRLEVGLGSSRVGMKPGMFVYLMVLEDWRWWQSHPFTVAGVRKGVCAKERLDLDENDELGPLLQLRQSLDGRMGEEGDGEVDEEVATILIRPYDQFTGRLRDLVKDGKRRSLRVIVEGPYGHSRRLDMFDKVVFIIGGSGIAVPLGYMSMLRKVRRVVIYWAVREEGFVRLVSRDLEGAEINVFVTGGGGGVIGHRDRDGDMLKMNKGRMNVVQKIEDEAEGEWTQGIGIGGGGGGGGGRMAVIGCGPRGMAEECREGVRRVVEMGRLRVEYFEESYHW